jgi:phenylpropionate dioxygenase-like ring-hydroxylating dioxygenase large terminal subunit
MMAVQLSALIDRQRPGWSLEQPFYLDPAIFALEQALWFPRQWTVVAHASELPRKGSHVVRPLFDASVVIVNAGEAGYRGYHNVCTHRGSRICKEDGHAPLLVCPYHAWSFRLTGELQTIKDLPEGIDPASLGLHEVPLGEIGGFILCGLDADTLPDPAPASSALLPALRHHGLDRAKIIERRSYPTGANWKLVIENFFECYHCRPSHPEYFRMNEHVKVTAVRDSDAAAQWEKVVASWRVKVGQNAHNITIRAAGDVDEIKFSLFRQPIGRGRVTQSSDGRPVAPLMGGFSEYDGGETAMHLGRFSFLGAYNDHAVLFQFIPRGVEDTDVIVTWLVNAEADTDVIDVEALTFLWDVTTKQDKQIIEENAAGVRSRAYRPGPYTLLEGQTADFVARYLDAMRQLTA